MFESLCLPCSSFSKSGRELGASPITPAAALWLSTGPAGRLSRLVVNMKWGTSPAIPTGTRATVADPAAVRPVLACFPGNGTLGFTGDKVPDPRGGKLRPEERALNSGADRRRAPLSPPALPCCLPGGQK